MVVNGHELDDVQVLRSRLLEYERLWQSASHRLAAFARLEELAEQQSTTPEALARRAALARYEERMGDLQAEVQALQATAAHLSAEVARFDERRAEAVRRFGEAHRQLEVVEGELERRSAEHEAIERELADLLAARQQRALEVQQLTESRDSLYLEVSELLEGMEALHQGGFATASDLNRVGPAVAGGKIDPDRYGADEVDGAFEEFFNADVGHDRSRDWILGGRGASD